MPSNSVARRPVSGSLAEVIDIILDKGLVLDVYVRVSVIGIELVTIDVRVVVASVDTYLHFAEATNRLDLRAQADAYETDLPELLMDKTREASKASSERAIDDQVERARSALHLGS